MLCTVAPLLGQSTTRWFCPQMRHRKLFTGQFSRTWPLRPQRRHTTRARRAASASFAVVCVAPQCASMWPFMPHLAHKRGFGHARAMWPIFPQ